jgi:hypothetical protein
VVRPRLPSRSIFCSSEEGIASTIVRVIQSVTWACYNPGTGARTSRFPHWVVPAYVAKTLTFLVEVTACVNTVKVAVVAPAGTVTLSSSQADPSLTDSIALAPPAGAGPSSVTVPVDCPVGPPMTLVGFIVTETRTAGITVSDAVRVVPP